MPCARAVLLCAQACAFALCAGLCATFVRTKPPIFLDTIIFPYNTVFGISIYVCANLGIHFEG